MSDREKEKINLDDCIVHDHPVPPEELSRYSVERDPVCKSREIRTHFDISIGDDGEYFRSCGVCDWTDHPEA